MPDEGRKQDEVEKILSDENSLVDRKKALIDGLLKEREAAIKSFDEKLARLGYRANCAKPKPAITRSLLHHHRSPRCGRGRGQRPDSHYSCLPCALR